MLNKLIYVLNQEELSDYIREYLNYREVEYTECDGMFYSLNKKGVAFVSHMDTVAKDDAEYHKPVFEADGILFKRNAILGADDRAGINLILNHCKDINFVITADEEVGRIGATKLSRDGEFVGLVKSNVVAFIELDRRGDNDILGFKHGYCDEALHEAVNNVLNGVDATGSYTDIDSWRDLKPGVNISVGYYNPHSADEFLDLKKWYELNSLIPELNRITGEFKTIEKQYVSKYSSSKYKYKRLTDYYGWNYSIPNFSSTSFPEVKRAVIVDYENSEILYQSVGGLKPEYVVDINTGKVNARNIVKHSGKYLECSKCHECINLGEMYDVVDDELFHQECNWSGDYDKQIK